MPRKPSPGRSNVSTVRRPVESRLAGVIDHHRGELPHRAAAPVLTSSTVLAGDKAVQTWTWGAGAAVVWAIGAEAGFRAFGQLPDAVDFHVRTAHEIAGVGEK